jgi:hypothetical protein
VAIRDDGEPRSLARNPQPREVYFFDGPTVLGIATNVDQPNYNGITAYAYCRKEDFAEWYGMLRNEAHLKFGYAYSGPDYDPNQPNRNLSWVQLYTGQPEPPGEGAEDLQARIFPAHMLEALRANEGAA